MPYHKKIVISSTQYPYYGGAATNAYALIKFFRSHGHRTAGIYFIDKNVNIDPETIGGVFRCCIHIDPKDSSCSPEIIKQSIIKYLGGEPDIIFGKNYYAPIASKDMFSNVKVIYLVAGSPQMMMLSEQKISACKYINEHIAITFSPENQCIIKSDIVVPNSRIANDLLIKNYGYSKKFIEPIDTSLAMNKKTDIQTKFEERKYDICFICSDLNRPVKNPELALKIFNEFKTKRKAIIGDKHCPFDIENTEYLGLVNQEAVIEIMQNSRLVICTSFYDASPNTIKEALSCGCNILLSKNCGWSEIYQDDSVCNDVYNVDEWINKTEKLLNKSIYNDFQRNENSLLNLLNNG